MSNLIQVKDATTGKLMSVDTYQHTIQMKDESGKLVTMDLGQSDVHIDAALSNYAAGFRQWEGIADEVAPVFHTPRASDRYYTWDKDDVFQQAEDLILGPDNNVKEVAGRVSSTAFTTVPFGLAASVPTELAANADAPLKIEQMYMRNIMQKIGIGREIRCANLIMASGSWTGGYTTTLGATAKWNGGSASNPVQDLYTAIEASLTPVRAIAMSERTWHDFVQNAAVQKYVASKVDAPPLPNSNADSYSRTTDSFSALLGLPKILIGRMKKKLTASTYGYVWSDNVALLYNDPSLPSDGQSISTARTFRWSGADAGAVDGNMQGGFLVRSYYDPRRGARGTRVMVVTHNDIEVMTTVFAGGLIINAHQ